MNKQDWTYKKLGEVCETSSGGTPSKSHKEYYEGGTIPWLRSGEVSQGLIYNTELFITDLGLEKSSAKIFPIDTVVIAMYGATVGQVGLLKKEMATNQAVCGIFPNNTLYPLFLLYTLKSKKSLFLKDAVGGAQPNISQNLIKNTIIPIPPIGEQERIVAELDLLQCIIEKKKEQLKAYDQLAQSIFYTMFGDPIDNPKGWETKKLGELCKKITDGTHNSPINTEIGDYKYITAKNIKKDGIILNNITYVSTDIHKAIYERCNPEYGDVLYIKDGITTGIATINTLKEEFSLLSSVALLKPEGCLMNYYLKAVLNMPSQYASIRENMGGAAITRLTIAKINEIRIPVPPLSLQEEFAEKVEAIERQKALVQQSIEETQTMFDFTMDKYFG